MSDKPLTMKIWIMAAAAIVVVGGGLIGLIWFIMSRRTSSNGIVVPKLTPDKIPYLIYDIKSQNNNTLAGLSTIIKFFDSSKTIEGEGTLEENTKQFFTKNPEIAFQIRQALDFAPFEQATTTHEPGSPLIIEDNFLREFNVGNISLRAVSGLSSDTDVESAELKIVNQMALGVVPMKTGIQQHGLFLKAFLMNNGLIKDIVRFFNKHLDKEHRLDIEKHCPWLSSEIKVCNDLNAFLVILIFQFVRRMVPGMINFLVIWLRAIVFEYFDTLLPADFVYSSIGDESMNNYDTMYKKLSQQVRKSLNLSEEEFDKMIQEKFKSDKSLDIDKFKSLVSLIDKEEPGEIAKLKYELAEMSDDDEKAVKKAELDAISQEYTVEKYFKLSEINKANFIGQKYIWWIFISLQVMKAAPHATVSVLQKILPAIKELPDGVKSSDDLTEDVCVTLLVKNIGNLEKSLMTKEEIDGADKEVAEEKISE